MFSVLRVNIWFGAKGRPVLDDVSLIIQEIETLDCRPGLASHGLLSYSEIQLGRF